MKKHAVILIALMWGWMLNAQVNIGIKLGIAATGVNVNATTNLDELDMPTARKLNYNVGLVGEFSLMKDMLALRTSLEYARKGYQIDLNKIKEQYQDIKSISGDFWNVYNYLQLPVQLVYSFNQFSVNAGPYLAYGLSGMEYADLHVEMNDGTSQDFKESTSLTPVMGTLDENLADITTDLNVLKYFNGLDYGLSFGFGFTYRDFLVNVQYQQGLANLTPDFKDPQFNPDDFKMRNNSINLEITYFLPLHKNKTGSTTF